MIYYVAKSGSDNNSGEKDTPFLTIGKAAKMVSPGDSVIISEGEYHEVVRIKTSGMENARIAFTAKPGDHVLVTGRAGVDGQNTGLPSKAWPTPDGKLVAPDGTRANTGNLVAILADYIDWHGINVSDSLGRGIAVTNASDIDIRDLTCGPNRQTNILIEKSFGVTIDNCKSVGSGSYYPEIRPANKMTDWSASIAIKAGHHIDIFNCIIHDNWGEVIIADANVGESTHVAIVGCTTYQNMKGLYLHGLKHSTLTRCFLYQPSGVAHTKKGISINSAEHNRFGDIETTDIEVSFNTIVGFATGILDQGGSLDRPMQRRVTIEHNTIVDCLMGISLVVGNKEDMRLAHNLVTHCVTMIDDKYDGERASKDWTFDNNLWDVPVSYPYSSLRDVIGDPILFDPLAERVAGAANLENYRPMSGSIATVAGGVDLGALEADTTIPDEVEISLQVGSVTWDITATENVINAERKVT